MIMKEMFALNSEEYPIARSTIRAMIQCTVQILSKFEY